LKVTTQLYGRTEFSFWDRVRWRVASFLTFTGLLLLLLPLLLLAALILAGFLLYALWMWLMFWLRGGRGSEYVVVVTSERPSWNEAGGDRNRGEGTRLQGPDERVIEIIDHPAD
jgi:hypothetical protein